MNRMINEYHHDTAFDDPIDNYHGNQYITNHNIGHENNDIDDDLFNDPSFDQYCQPTPINTLNISINNSIARAQHSNDIIDLTDTPNNKQSTPYRNRLSLHTHSQYTHNGDTVHAQSTGSNNLLNELNQSMDYDNTCCICLEHIAEECELNSCTHKYCLKCIIEWSHTATSCPSCRAEFNEIRHITYSTPNKKTRHVQYIQVEQRKQNDDADDGIDDADRYVCGVCGGGDNADMIVLCDYITSHDTNTKCNAGYHIYCLRPRLHLVPDGDWYCPTHSRTMRLQQPRSRQLRTQQQLNYESAISRATRNVTRVQPNRTRNNTNNSHRRHNNGGGATDDDNLVSGYDSDDGFVVSDDTIIYDTQANNNNRRNNRTRSNGFPNSPDIDDDYNESDISCISDSTASTASELDDVGVARVRTLANTYHQRYQQQRNSQSSTSSRRQRDVQRSRSVVNAIRQHNQRIKQSNSIDNVISSSTSDRSRSNTTTSTTRRNGSSRNNNTRNDLVTSLTNAVTQRINSNMSTSTAVNQSHSNNNRLSSTSTTTRPYSNTTFPIPSSRVMNGVISSLGVPSNDMINTTSQPQYKRLRRAHDVISNTSGSTSTGSTVSPYFTSRTNGTSSTNYTN